MSKADKMAALEARLDTAKQRASQYRSTIVGEKEQLADTTLVEFGRQVAQLPKNQMKLRRTLKGHLNKVVSVAWSTDSRQLCSAAQDGKLVLWDAMSGNKQQVISCQSTWTMSCAMSPSGRLVAAGGLDNICSVYNLKESEAALSQAPKDALATFVTRPTKALDGHVGFVSGIKFLNEGQLITASGDQTCSQWDIERAKQTVIYKGHEADVMGLALLREAASGTTNTFVSASGDSSVRLWDIRSGSCERIFFTEGTQQDLLCIDAFPDGMAFAAGSEDGAVRFFDIRSDRLLHTFAPERPAGEEQRQVTSVAFTRSGRGLCVGYDEEFMRVWDLFKGDVVATVKAHEERVSTLAVSPDGNALASGSWDKVIRIWA